jgi:hypothetical protein
MLIEVIFFSSLCIKIVLKHSGMEDPVEGCYVVVMQV